MSKPGYETRSGPAHPRWSEARMIGSNGYVKLRVGIADLADCVDKSDDPYFVGEFGLVLENARPLRFQPCRGMLGLFNPKITVDLSPP